MGKKKRKFIDKRYDNIYSFKVVQRSQQDPLVADETAPQAVLIDAASKKEQEKEELHKYGIYYDDDYDYLQHMRGAGEGIDWENCEMEVYTIRKEDPKRKKGSKKETGLLLPSSAFESYVEEPVGLLNKASSVIDLGSDVDSDIAAALNSDEEQDMFDPEDEEAIPDNFVSLLNADDAIEEEEEEEDFSVSEEIRESGNDVLIEHNGIQEWLSNTEYYNDDLSRYQNGYHDMPALEGSSDDEYYDAESEENGNYDDDDDDYYEAEEERDEVTSLPSINRKAKIVTLKCEEANNSPVYRTELQKFFDAKFESLYEREYGDDQIDLDPDLIRGPLDVDNPVFQQAMAATRKQLAKLKLDAIEGEDKDRTVEWVKNNMNLRNDMQGEKEEFIDIEVETKPKFDLQSFHEALAKRQQVIRPKYIDLDNLVQLRKSKSKLTKRAVKEHNRAYRSEDEETSSESESEDLAPTFKSQISMLSERPKGETPEERRERKHQLKLLRKTRRQEKKINKLIYNEASNDTQKNSVRCRIHKLGKI